MEILSNRAVRGNQITGGTYHNSKDGGGGELNPEQLKSEMERNDGHT